jgi:hypothetical protein
MKNMPKKLLFVAVFFVGLLVGVLVSWPPRRCQEANDEKFAALMLDNTRMRAELEETKEISESYRRGMFKSQALIGFMRDTPEIIPLMRTKEFREKFKPDWWNVDLASKWLGERWFFREVIEQKVAKPGAFGPDLEGYESSEWDEPAKSILHPK